MTKTGPQSSRSLRRGKCRIFSDPVVLYSLLITSSIFLRSCFDLTSVSCHRLLPMSASRLRSLLENDDWLLLLLLSSLLLSAPYLFIYPSTWFLTSHLIRWRRFRRPLLALCRSSPPENRRTGRPLARSFSRTPSSFFHVLRPPTALCVCVCVCVCVCLTVCSISSSSWSFPSKLKPIISSSH